jgi:[protein-PII] uridylyltransferase
MIRLGAPLADIIDSQFLVREHLAMPRISQRRDLSDDQLIKEFADKCGDVGRLSRLYVLAYVDTRSTGPTLWTPWKAALLKQLYDRTKHFLEAPGTTAVATDSNLPARVRQVFTEHELAALLEAKTDRGRVFWGESVHGYRPLYVVTPDRAGLVATVAGVAAEQRLSIASAELFSTPDAWALDRFMVRYAGPEPEHAEERFQAALGRLDDALRSGWSLASFSSPPFRAPFLLPGVKVALGERTGSGQVVDVFAPDRPGLLFDLARAIFVAGYSIAIAKISTEGARAIDAFYVQRARDDAETLELLQEHLARAAAPVS